MTDAAAMEKAADEFVAKYPDSELKSAVYQRTMVAYQSAGNDEKTMETGKKALSYNPDDPGVLVALSDMIAQRTRETDLDRDERLAEATKMAQHALETVGDFPAPQNMPSEQVEAVKNQMRGAAYGVIGMANYTQKKYPEAEAAFKQAVDVTKADPDPTIYLRLTLTLDKMNKYQEALDAANKTLTLVPADSQVAALATQEKGRLTQLLNSAQKTTPKAPPTSPQPTNPQ
jgi:tetratricopeptide (TPR) repeat protein